MKLHFWELSKIHDWRSSRWKINEENSSQIQNLRIELPCKICSTSRDLIEQTTAKNTAKLDNYLWNQQHRKTRHRHLAQCMKSAPCSAQNQHHAQGKQASENLYLFSKKLHTQGGLCLLFIEL